ncbi:trehalase-like domain-containing protein [Paenarthrobacter sp. NPDC018779]|uniref:trehalase-like domain-containing protein n=1 Tax=Paenarthrobacter sp. NPDC018779 TaxID=3364375 RepID=UPI0037C530F1
MADPIEDYALLSDLSTGPLVSRRGSLDWACFPRFDSPAQFSALLGSRSSAPCWDPVNKDGGCSPRVTRKPW